MGYQNKRVPKCLFQNSNTCLFENPSVLIPLCVLLKRHTQTATKNEWGTKMPGSKRNQSLPFWKPSVMIHREVLLKNPQYLVFFWGGGLSNGALRCLSSVVHYCLHLSSFSPRKFPLQTSPKMPQMCTIAYDCARVAESGLVSLHLRAPIQTFPIVSRSVKLFGENCIWIAWKRVNANLYRVFDKPSGDGP